MPTYAVRPAAVLAALLLAAAAPAGALYRIDTFAGRGYGDGGPAIAAAVKEPTDAATDPAGNVYFTDRGNHLVRRVDAATGTISTVAGNSAPGFGGDGGPAVLANLFEPDGVGLDAAGQTLYIVENAGSRLRRVDLATGIISSVAGTGVHTGNIDGEGGNPVDDLGDGGPAFNASFNQPVGVAVDAQGNVFVAERSELADRGPARAAHPSHRPRDRRHHDLRRRPHEGFNGDGHPALESQLADPIGSSSTARATSTSASSGTTASAGSRRGGTTSSRRSREPACIRSRTSRPWYRSTRAGSR
jgi:hypothetical protein